MTLTINLNGDVAGTNNGNVVVAINGSSPLPIAPAILQWISSITSPTLTQTSNTFSGATGQALTIMAQSTTGTGTTIGGNLNLNSGTGATGGTINVIAGAGTTAGGTLNLAAGTASTAAGTGDVNIQGGSPSSLVNIVTFNATDFDNDGLVETMGIGSSMTSPRIYQITGSGAGTNLTIQAQNAAGSNNNGGSLLLKGGTATGTGTTGGIIPSVQVRTNSSNTTYTIDSTGGGSDYHILHNNFSGYVSYVLPTPTAGRELLIRDITGAINTTGYNVFIVPHAAEAINTSYGYYIGPSSTTNTTFSITKGSTSVTAGASLAGILTAGMSIFFNSDLKSYIVSAFNGTTGITLASAYTGTTSSTATGTISSLTFAANYGVLRLVSDGTNWYAKGDGTLTTVTFTSSGTWIPPQGVTSATVTGYGGGGGGGGGAGNATNAGGGGGGGGAIQSTVTVTVTPSFGYVVTIGAGGTGATAVTNAAGNVGGSGGNTTLGGILALFSGASGGGSGCTTANSTANTAGGLCNKTNSIVGNTQGNLYSVAVSAGVGLTSNGVNVFVATPAGGGFSGAFLAGSAGGYNLVTNNNIADTVYAPGSGGAVAGSGTAAGGGGGGGQGPGGNGGNGGAGVATGTANAGSSAAANTGAGGGGGGGLGATSPAAGAGGNGGSGWMQIVYSL
jgi:hypothetical protein